MVQCQLKLAERIGCCLFRRVIVAVIGDRADQPLVSYRYEPVAKVGQGSGAATCLVRVGCLHVECQDVHQ